MKHYSSIPLVARAMQFSKKMAIISKQGSFTYSELDEISQRVASGLLNGEKDLSGARVAFLTVRGFEYVAAQWGIWRAGGIAVPLCEVYPFPELEYVVRDCGATIVISDQVNKERIQPITEKLDLRFALIQELIDHSKCMCPEILPERAAMIIYTSGTTSKPKGVVITHKNIESQIKSLVQAWEWNSSDYILSVLPLHHVHGIINVISCALWAGALCEITSRFDALEVWDRFIEKDYTLFMAVPTIYSKLINVWENSPRSKRNAMTKACTSFRLMVSGSAALPATVFKKWEEISGHILLERYGMTEAGMILSNPLHGERIPGTVGFPLPGVEVRLMDERGIVMADGKEGEIQVKGPGVFLEYWNRPDETRKAWKNGWFSTGDIAVREKGRYRILGRKSIDIIKTGGYKVSALEIEEVYRSHYQIKDCAVVGVQDDEWGERICIGIIPKNSEVLSLDEIRAWGKKRLAPYKVPTKMLVMEDLPRNLMGKVNKKRLAELFLLQ